MRAVLLSFLLLFTFDSFCQDYPKLSSNAKEVLVFDPNGVSASFQSSFSQLSNDLIALSDTLDETINNYDALFLFIGGPYQLSQEEGNFLIDYLNQSKPIYLYSDVPAQRIDSVAFWDYIGITSSVWFPTLTTIDRVEGVDTTFTADILIDTNFISGSIPAVLGDVVPILRGVSDTSLSLTTSYIPADSSLQVIIDLFNLIHHPEFLERVLDYFELSIISSIEPESNFPQNFILSQNYPNPFNPSTSIQHTIGSRQFITLKVYDVLGNEIASLVNEEKSAGTYNVEFTIDNLQLTSGVYFYQLRAGTFVETKKMVLIK